MSAIAALSTKRCFNHGQREAVARCPVCGNFFCRECITEHDGRMICSRCLAPRGKARRKGRILSGALRGCQLMMGIFLLWIAFFLMGRALLRIPSSFHDGSIWGSIEGAR